MRVGGGWDSLEHYLLSQDKCLACGVNACMHVPIHVRAAGMHDVKLKVIRDHHSKDLQTHESVEKFRATQKVGLLHTKAK